MGRQTNQFGKGLKREKRSKNVRSQVKCFNNVFVHEKSQDYVFEFGEKKKISVSLFDGRLNIQVRQYFTPDGATHDYPGKVGIVLNLQQWQMLKSQIDAIDEIVNTLVADPHYIGNANANANVNEETDLIDEDNDDDA